MLLRRSVLRPRQARSRSQAIQVDEATRRAICRKARQHASLPGLCKRRCRWCSCRCDCISARVLRFNPVKGPDSVPRSIVYMFWPDSKYGSGTSQVLLNTREWRVEGGLRYHYNILNKRNMPSVLFNAQYGAHFFAVAKEQKVRLISTKTSTRRKADGINDHGLPDILYQYVTIGLGARIPYFVTEKLYRGFGSL